MRVKSIHLKAFKRFTDLSVGPIPSMARLIVLLGPNGCGKSSLLEAFNHWHALHGWGNIGDQRYLLKDGLAPNPDWQNHVNVVFHENEETGSTIRNKLYFRTAFRNEPDLDIKTLQQMPSPTERPVLDRFISNEASVTQNYHRLVGKTLKSVYDSSNETRSVADLKNELIGKINTTLTAIFDDLALGSIGDPLNNGAFYFRKGISTSFHYKNLSAGEKSVFDLILDIALNSTYYPDAVFFIDEPEAHIHTEKQASTLRSLFNLIPLEGQLWCSTHSLGMLMEAREIEQERPGEVVFIDLNDRDFDLPQIISASRPDRQLWDKILELTLGSLSKFIGPNRIYLCEGDPSSRRNKSFDAQVLERIFGAAYPNSIFISVGNSDDVINTNGPVAQALLAIFPNTQIMRVIDRDYRSDTEVRELRDAGVCVMSERHLESYLLSDEIIAKLCIVYDQASLIDEALRKKEENLERTIRDGRDRDDIKSAAGLIVNSLRSLLQIRNGGSSTHPFLRDTMAPLITCDTLSYQNLIRDLDLD